MKINQCQKCGHVGTSISNTRHWNGRTRRTRTCYNCGHKWYTMEIMKDSTGVSGDDLQGLINLVIDSLRKKSLALKKDVD